MPTLAEAFLQFRANNKNSSLDEIITFLFKWDIERRREKRKKS
jgi:hypothetical protein